MNESRELSAELLEATKQIPIVIGGVYHSVFTSLHQLLQAWIEAADRQGFRQIR